MKNRVLILGSDGYLGRALFNRLKNDNYVVGLDNGLRERNVREIGGSSLIDLPSTQSLNVDICDYEALKSFVDNFKPDTIVHFAEQPSAPFSMIDREHAVETQRNNILGTMNVLWAIKGTDIHLIKLGSMGVYGTPDADIPETDAPIAYDPASFYHISKAADSINIRKACQWWGINATDLHQGVVYGHMEGTRFDYDEYFGTVINRFLVQALVDMPLTVYGAGGQTRGFINIKDTMACIQLAIENPAKGYRVFNQLTEIFSVNYLARQIGELTGAKIEHLDNPRYEREEHYYKPKYEALLKLGLEPRFLKDELPLIWDILQPYKNMVKLEVIKPKTKWK